MKKTFALLFLICLTSCANRQDQSLCCIQLADRSDVVETIGFEDRLRTFENCNFLAPQPYKKVVRVFNKNKMGQALSIITSYHTNGLIHQYLEVVDSRAHGFYKEWHENGKLKIEATLVGGEGDISLSAQASYLFDNICKYFDEKGSIKVEFVYKNGLLEGEAKYYYPFGQIKKIIPYKQNLIEGEILTYAADGKFLSKTSYKKNVKQGDSIAYWDRDKLKHCETFENGLLVNAQYFDINKNIVAKIAQAQGYKALFKKAKLYKLIEYKNGLAEGKVQVFNNEKLERSYFQKGGKKEGEESLYFDNQKMKLLINWHQGQIHGLIKSWYENGLLESQREFAHNQKNGTFCSWAKDGKLMFVEEYENDKLAKGSYYHKDKLISSIIAGTGVAIFYDGDGLFLKKIKYKNSEIVDDER